MGWAAQVYSLRIRFTKRNLANSFFCPRGVSKVPRRGHSIPDDLGSREDCADLCESNQICADRHALPCSIGIRTASRAQQSHYPPKQETVSPRSLFGLFGKLARTRSQGYDVGRFGRVNLADIDPQGQHLGFSIDVSTPNPVRLFPPCVYGPHCILPLL